MSKRIQGYLIAAVCVIALMIAVFAFYSRETRRPAPPPRPQHLVGANITLSGTFAYFGQQFQKGLLLAEDDARRAGLGVRILYQDNQHDTTQALGIFERFANVDKVSAIVSLYSPVSLAIRDSAGRYQVPLVTTYTTAKNLPAANEWTFRDFPTMEAQASAMAAYLFSDLGCRQAAVIGFNTDFGKDGHAEFSRKFQALGGEVLPPEYVTLSTVDVRPQVTKLVAETPDCMFLVLSAKALAQSVITIRDLKYRGLVAGVIMFDSPEVWSIAGDAANDVYFPSIALDLTSDPRGTALLARYRKRYNEEPDYVAVYGYSIGKYVIDAVNSGAGDRRRVRDTLANLNIDTVRGRVTVQPSRDIYSPIAIFRRVGGKNVFVKAVEGL